ncbi:MAG: hypothetical protein ACOX1Y_03965 [Zhaonellaceae bacterium]|jgi:hypothetical protein
MKNSKHEGKGIKNNVLTATLILGAITMLFLGIIQVAAETEYNKINIIPTSYANYTEEHSKTVQNSLPEGYKKADYTVGTIDLEYYKKQSPTSKDMKKEDAAEIGAQALWSVFRVNLDGQVIEMGYHAPNEGLPRPRWNADVNIDGEGSYSFSVDSVTGELLSIGRSRTLTEEVSVAFDPLLDKNPQEFIELAWRTAETLNIVNGPVLSVEYNGQGFANNDPSISLDIKGENGKMALMTFSRYDKALLGISYNAEYKYTLEIIERMEQELDYLNSISTGNENGKPTLKVLEER